MATSCNKYHKKKKKKKQQFWNLMHIILFKVFCSSFSANADCTFDWPIIKLNNLTNSVCFRVRSLTKKTKKWNMESTLEVHSRKYSAWGMKTIWKYSLRLLMPKWTDGIVLLVHIHTLLLLTFYIATDNTYFLLFGFTIIVIIFRN